MVDAIAKRDAWCKANVPGEAAPSSSMATRVVHICGKREGKSSFNSNSSYPKFGDHEFLSLHDTSHLKQRKTKKFRPPFDTEDWHFKYSTKEKEFPFDEVADEVVKIKFNPIRLRWP